MNPRLRTLLLTPLFCLASLMLPSCGGSSSHTVAVNTTGSLRGLDFAPADHTLRVDTGVKCRLYWHTGYAPPSQFVVSLKKVSLTSKKESVRTELNRIGDGYVWELAPVSRLTPETVYFIEVEATPEYEVGMFLTEPDSDRASADATPVPSPRGAFEHRVVVIGDGTP